AKTGTATVDWLYAYRQLENDGTVTSSSKALQWNSGNNTPNPTPQGDGVSDGLFTTTGSGSIELGGTVSTATTYGPNVWITGTLYGTVNLPAGVTLNVGDDPTTPTTELGTIAAPTQGAGTLRVLGNPTLSYPTATIAADLTNTTVQIDHTTLATKADNTPLQISPATTVTV